MEAGKCKTCETIKWLKEQAKQHESKRKIRNTLKITLTQETRVDGVFSGRMNISGSRMMFCPECGRKLRKSETMYECRKAEVKTDGCKLRNTRLQCDCR